MKFLETLLNRQEIMEPTPGFSASMHRIARQNSASDIVAPSRQWHAKRPGAGMAPGRNFAAQRTGMFQPIDDSAAKLAWRYRYEPPFGACVPATTFKTCAIGIGAII